MVIYGKYSVGHREMAVSNFGISTDGYLRPLLAFLGLKAGEQSPGSHPGPGA